MQEACPNVRKVKRKVQLHAFIISTSKSSILPRNRASLSIPLWNTHVTHARKQSPQNGMSCILVKARLMPVQSIPIIVLSLCLSAVILVTFYLLEMFISSCFFVFVFAEFQTRYSMQQPKKRAQKLHKKSKIDTCASKNVESYAVQSALQFYMHRNQNVPKQNKMLMEKVCTLIPGIFWHASFKT